MSKSDEAERREHRLAAKLRDNLKRRKQQARARAGQDARDTAGAEIPPVESEPEAALQRPADSDS